LLELAHNLTAFARSAYFHGEGQIPAKLIKANEFQNRLTRMAADALRRKQTCSEGDIADSVLGESAELDAVHFVEQVADHWGQRP
jgi:hypothetical protein